MLERSIMTSVTQRGMNTTVSPIYNTSVAENTSGLPSHVKPDDRDFEYVIRCVVAAVFSVIFVIGILGNSLVIYIIASRRRMRTVSNLLLMNLAFADLTFILFCVPTTGLNYVFQSWPLGVAMCKTSQYILFVTVYVTIYTLMMISAIRFLAVVFPLQSSNLRTRKNAVICIFVIWVIMLAVNIPVLVSCKTVTYEYHGEERSACLIDLSPDYAMAKVYYASFFVFAYLLPLIVICALAGGIVRKLMAKIENNQERVKMRRKREATKTTIFVVLVFAISWLPINIILMINYFGTEDLFTKLYVVFQVMANCLSYSNSCINPVLYNFLSKDFRRQFYRTLCCKKHSYEANFYSARMYSAASAAPRDRTTVSFRISFKHTVNHEHSNHSSQPLCDVKMEEIVN